MPEIYPQAELSHKILIVGGARCGKSALARFYAEQPPKQHYSQTIGSDLYVVPYGVLCGRQVYLKLVDVGHAEVRGSPSFLSLTTADTAGVLLMFDVTNPKSLSALDEWAATLRSYIPSLGSRVPVMVLAHKADRLQNRTTTQHIKSTDLDRFVHANRFTGWNWSSTYSVPGSSRLVRSIPDAIHSLVEAVLISAAKFYSTTRKSFSGAIVQNGSGTLAQMLRTHQSATYVQIPQTALPGESKLEDGAALLLPIGVEEVVVLPCVVLGSEVVDNSSKDNSKDNSRSIILYTKDITLLYSGVQSQLQSMLKQLEKQGTFGGDRIRKRIEALGFQRENEMAQLLNKNEENGGTPKSNETVPEIIRRWQMILRQVEELM